MASIIHNLLLNSNAPKINIYFTAGYPTIDSIVPILRALQDGGADIVELGIPYSDPLADGPTIQESSSVALSNGMNLKLLFDEVASARQHGITIPIILMGYYNQMLQYGDQRFIEQCVTSGVNGLIIPDLPMEVYEERYRHTMTDLHLGISFLITPHTSTSRVQKAASLSSDFLYVVSQSSITGSNSGLDDAMAYFKRLDAYDLPCPKMVGFGIHDKATYDMAATYSNGCIVGSAFIRHLTKHGVDGEAIKNFIGQFRP